MQKIYVYKKKSLVVRALITFLAITGAVSLAVHFSEIQFGDVDFWEVHSIWFLIFISFFPRLTLIFSSVPFGGVLWWLGLIFAPRILVATLATVTYWKTNPLLVIISWLIALGGESGEKVMIRRRSKNYIDADYREVN